MSDPDITSHPRLSPLHAEIGPHCCPAVIVSTDLDPLVADGVTYAHSLVQAGVDVQFRHLHGVPHGIFTSGSKYPVADEVLDDACLFIQRVTHPLECQEPNPDHA
ncbi:alpha/beta hydrolase [Auritidibacter ignavus]|uniref:alpha/beta hydrolase n=1 Tax=Auritidibacter ignavus TaxID=678932 RepID=UPI00244BFECA|nr:alpha/beta hydrolase fold domain-containing protein [Auritidibacter ignavus]WGH85131.1 alpha/beta hydrolase fold domain-containing protein [Auritidibacter ignavus]